MLQLRNIALGVFVVLMLGSITHMIGSDVFTIGTILVAAALGYYYFNDRFSAASRVARGQADSSRSAALSEVPPPGSGFLYVYREGRSFTPGPVLQVSVDDDSRAELKNSQFVRLTLSAGEHRLNARTKAESATGQNVPANANLLIEGGESVYFVASTTMSATRYTVLLTPDSEPSTASVRFTRFEQVTAA